MTIITTLLTVLLILLVISYLLPSHAKVERSVAIAAPPEQVWPHLASFQAMRAWSPWAHRDPDARWTYLGPEAGVGAKMAWEGDPKKVGSGSQEIIAQTEGRHVSSKLDFGKRGTAIADLHLEADGAGSRVRWSLDAPLGMNPVGRWMGLALDGLVGADYERGLAQLKAAVEG